MSFWPATLQDWAIVAQTVLAVIGLLLAHSAYRAYQGQTQHQSSQVTIHNYPEAPRFGEGQVEAKKP